MVRSFLIAALMVVVGCGCDSAAECPARGGTRCNGSVAEICDADMRWQSFLDCADIGPDWVCEPVDAGHTCVPREDSATDGGSR